MSEAKSEWQWDLFFGSWLTGEVSQLEKWSGEGKPFSKEGFKWDAPPHLLWRGEAHSEKCSGEEERKSGWEGRRVVPRRRKEWRRLVWGGVDFGEEEVSVNWPERTKLTTGTEGEQEGLSLDEARACPCCKELGMHWGFLFQCWNRLENWSPQVGQRSWILIRGCGWWVRIQE